MKNSVFEYFAIQVYLKSFFNGETYAVEQVDC